MRIAGSHPQDVPPVGELLWSLATSYKGCEVVFMGAGRTCFCRRAFSWPVGTIHNEGVTP